MKIRMLLVVSLCAALSLGVLATGPARLTTAAAVAPPPPIHVMLAGDSISQGFDGDFTWRYRLYQEFGRQHVPVDFVGPYQYTYGGAKQYLVPTGWDTDHDAVGGTRLQWQVENKSIRADMANPKYATPDVLVALYGTTDMLPHPGESEPQRKVSEVIADWKAYIQDARDVNANVKIIIGEVTTRRIAARDDLNKAVRTMAGQLNTAESPIVVADMDYQGWDPNKYTYDDVHPNPTGESIIAQRVADQLHALGVLPSTPQKFQTIRWTPPLAPADSTANRRVVVDWATTKYRYKPQLVRVRVRYIRTNRTWITGWTSATRYTSGVQRRGRYQISIQGRRQAMISTWSPIRTVRIWH